MLCRTALATLAATGLLLAGCGTAGETVIPAEPAERGGADLGLGPGVRPLTFGPGDKGSPRWRPSGDRLAFALDGYVVDKPPDSRELRRRTTRDFGAEEVEWVSSGNDLTILGPDLSGADPSSQKGEEAPRAIYRTSPGAEEGLGVDEIATGVLAMSPLSGRKLLVALEMEASTSALVKITDDGELSRAYPFTVEGRISGLSVSSDGSKVVAAVRQEPSGSFGIHVFDLSKGTSRRFSDLAEGQEVFGAPQWTKHGIFYVAGEARTDESGDAVPYDLYRLPSHPGDPKPVAGVGEDFVASSLKVSPDGERLAIVGRRNPNSPTELYVLDLSTGVLEAATANENMEIKTGPDDLAWSADGEHIAIVARGILSGHRVYAVRADSLLADFYNIYDVPVADLDPAEESRAG